jgi:Tfp pilus assembly protein PilV
MKDARMTWRRSQAGISMIEVLSAIALFSIVAAGITTSTTSNMKLGSRSKTIAAATALAQNKIEKIRMISPQPNTIPADLTLGIHTDSPNPMTALGTTGGNFTRTGTVTGVSQYLNGSVVGLRPGVVQVVVTVSWTTPVAGSVAAVTYACTTPTCGSS